MPNRIESFVIGAAVAALVILPAKAKDWTQIDRPAQTFQAHAVDLEKVSADVTVKPVNGPANVVSLQISGPRDLVDEVKSRTASGVLTVSGPRDEHSFSVWDWSKWFDYSHLDDKNKIKITLTVPRGSAITAKHMFGDLVVGDLDGKVWVETASGDVRIGRVSEATVKAVGSGDIQIGAVNGPLDLNIAGSGDVKVTSAAGARVSIAGSGDTVLGAINGPLKADIAGSGDLSIDSVAGPVVLSIAGAGDTRIHSGHADPLKVSIVGAGDLEFGGEAVDPQISAIGSGDVWLKSYSGKLNSSGMASVRVGGKPD
ncbi:MAG: DUF2807 domain-containing protein [Alphaproteobacteria bacterium]|nr:DUF2807 domain-containing protein [Alphaproteobacteria bacterium]MDE2109556.1 DUF2807 domain-containing protein [Alphaproteobacteria bacterium]MDE2493341.1 DUF2807 domain-containing protein [Alphaproteobacteria bacterium]